MVSIGVPGNSKLETRNSNEELAGPLTPQAAMPAECRDSIERELLDIVLQLYHVSELQNARLDLLQSRIDSVERQLAAEGRS